MIDTLKIYTIISKELFYTIESRSLIKSALNKDTGEQLYNIINSHLEGSYSSSLSVRLINTDNYYIYLEGSAHKLKFGYNSHNGNNNFIYCANYLIGIVEDFYKIELPQIEKWFVQRVDFCKVFDLENQENIINYINNLKKCSFPSRIVNFYKNQSLYCSGSTTTLKIYNKLLEFQKHDLKKLKNTNFDLYNYIDFIKGFIRFEIEIKKRKLLKFYNKEKDIKIIDIKFSDILFIWGEEFMKLLKSSDKESFKVNEKEKIRLLLYKNFKSSKARNLYNFYLSIIVDGYDYIKMITPESSFYRYIRELKKLNIDLSQSLNVDFDNIIVNFNPFTFKEVA